MVISYLPDAEVIAYLEICLYHLHVCSFVTSMCGLSVDGNISPQRRKKEERRLLCVFSALLDVI